MSVQDNIIKLRQLTGVTQEQLAEIAEVSRGAVSLWEIGKTEPRMGAVQLIADHFHLKKANIIEDGGMDNIGVALSGRLYEMSNDDLTFTSEEIELVKLYRAANAQGRAAIIAVAKSQVGMEEESEGNRRAM